MKGTGLLSVKNPSRRSGRHFLGTFRLGSLPESDRQEELRVQWAKGDIAW